jgi:hypothetical protein
VRGISKYLISMMYKCKNNVNLNSLFLSSSSFQIAHNSMRRLAEVKGLSEQKIQKFKDIIKSNELVQMGFQTAATRLGAMNEMIKISTGKDAYQAPIPFHLPLSFLPPSSSFLFLHHILCIVVISLLNVVQI